MKRYTDIAGDGGSGILGQVAERAERLAARLRPIRRTVAVMSGKGGVGKSAVTVNLAAALAVQGYKVGVLDADLNGPSIAKMLGVRDQTLRFEGGSVVPAGGPMGIRVLSMDLFLPSDEAPVVWEAPTQHDSFVWRATHEASALREFLADTLWGELDFLFLDLPPGTDRIPHVLGLLPEGTEALLVTIPSEVAQLVVRRSVTMARDVLRVPVVGLLENMGAYVCSKCGTRGHLFHDGGSERIARDMGIPFLGSVPFDPRISACGDRGVPFVLEHADAPAGKAFAEVAARVEQWVI